MSRHDGGPHDGSPATSPYPLQRLSAPHDLVDVAREIQKADGMLSAVVGAKLESIARQIRALQEEARVALESARRDAELHRARCTLRISAMPMEPKNQGRFGWIAGREH